MNLNFKASNIALAEEQDGKNFLTTISELGTNVSFADLLFLVHAGGGNSEDFDKEMEKGMEEILLSIMEGLNKSGFLKMNLDIDKLRRDMKDQMKKVEISQTSGESKKK